MSLTQWELVCHTAQHMRKYFMDDWRTHQVNTGDVQQPRMNSTVSTKEAVRDAIAEYFSIT